MFTYAGAFSGIGMLEHACERLGGEPVFMCESEPFCQRVLRRRFPGVPLIENVHDLNGADYAGFVDVFAFGFPCQDISGAGKGKGIKGERSGLWKEGFRVLSEMRPKIALIENVAMLKTRGLDHVLSDLWSIGYHAEWDIISAAAVGAPHLRERIWIIARPAEIAHLPVYGEVAQDKKGEAKTFSVVGKLPRAGRMGEELHELVPIAPRKTKRKDGWSYWVGVNLFGDDQRILLPTPTNTMGDRGGRGDLIQVVRGNKSPSGHFSSGDDPRLLWPSSSSSRDHKDVGDLNNVPDNSLLPRRVFHVEQGTTDLPMWPTPDASVAQDGERTETWFARRERLKETSNNGNGAGIPLTIAALADAEGKRMWPTTTTTTTTDAKAARNETAIRSNPDSKHHSGRTLLDAIIIEHEASGIETAVDASRGDSIIKIVAAGGIGEATSLRTTGISEPSGRSGPLFPTPSAVSGEQGPGRSGRKGGDNLVTRVNGSLNPTWVEWLMAIPLWWTDPNLPTMFTSHVSWDNEPLDLAPRVATGIPLRSARLKAIGNSVVWLCAYYALSRALAATPQVGAEEPQLLVA